MANLTYVDLLKAYIFCFAFLALKMFFTALSTGFVRSKYKSPASAEDAKLGNTGDPNVIHPAVQRHLNIHRNDIENVLPGFISATLYVFSVSYGGGYQSQYLGGIILISLFTFFRLFHHISYQFELQPWRTLNFALAVVCAIIFNIWAIVIGLSFTVPTFP